MANLYLGNSVKVANVVKGAFLKMYFCCSSVRQSFASYMQSFLLVGIKSQKQNFCLDTLQNNKFMSCFLLDFVIFEMS